jgi:hypothetical protein
MHTPRVLSLSSSRFTPMAARMGNLASLALLAGSLAGLAPQAHADEFQTFLGAGVGAVTGAVIGKQIGGRNGAILGAGAGGLVGASIASQHYYAPGYAPNPYPVATTYYQPQPTTYYQQPVTVYQAPQPQYRVVEPVTYYQPAVYTVQAPPIYYRPDYGYRHHHRGGYYSYDYRR